MLIRTEIGSDIPRITSFFRDELREPKIEEKVANIREQALITLGMLAIEESGQVVGYIICSPVLVNDQDQGWLSISVLLTNPSARYAQLAQTLTREAIDSLYEFGYNAVVLFADDYPEARTGFVLAKNLTFKGVPSIQVWVHPLYDEQAAQHHAEITWPSPQQTTNLTDNSAVD